MIASCESCGEDFLTESDPHVVRPTKNGYKFYCYCHIKGFDEVKTKSDKKDEEIKSLKNDLNQANQILWDICDKWKDTVSYEQAAYEVRQVLGRQSEYLKRIGI
jgi:hypothetical protein